MSKRYNHERSKKWRGFSWRKMKRVRDLRAPTAEPDDYDVEQREVVPMGLSAGSPSDLVVLGPVDAVPPQARPGSPCLRAACPKNHARVCRARLDDEPCGHLAPVRPLCPKDDLT